MNLSIVLSTQPSSFSALAYQGELEGNIEKIARLGYNGVELAVRDPAILDIAAVEKAVIKQGLIVPAIGTGQAYGEEGLSLSSLDAGVREQAIERLTAHAELAARFEAIVIVGLLRGQTGGGSDRQQPYSLMLDGLRTCAHRCPGVKFAVEPINRYETDLINTVSSGLDLVEAIGMNNVGLLLDTFHMNIEEPDILESIRSARDSLFHFHVADSNRWYPGAGHIDFAEIVELLDKVGYDGFISAEIMPLPDPDTAAAKTIEYMQVFTTCCLTNNPMP